MKLLRLAAVSLAVLSAPAFSQQGVAADAEVQNVATRVANLYASLGIEHTDVQTKTTAAFAGLTTAIDAFKSDLTKAGTFSFDVDTLEFTRTGGVATFNELNAKKQAIDEALLTTANTVATVLETDGVKFIDGELSKMVTERIGTLKVLDTIDPYADTTAYWNTLDDINAIAYGIKEVGVVLKSNLGKYGVTSLKKGGGGEKQAALFRGKYVAASGTDAAKISINPLSAGKNTVDLYKYDATKYDLNKVVSIIDINKHFLSGTIDVNGIDIVTTVNKAIGQEATYGTGSSLFENAVHKGVYIAKVGDKYYNATDTVKGTDGTTQVKSNATEYLSLAAAAKAIYSLVPKTK